MDGIERRVFRRKHALLSTLLQPTPAYLTALRQQGILTADMVNQVKRVSDNDKMPLLLKVMETNIGAALTKVTFMLEQTGHSWVADELFADLQYERGKLKLELYIIKEAEYVTNALFGDNTYIDDSRKVDLVRILASRHQIAKEAWKRQMSRRHDAMAEEIGAIQNNVLKMFEDVDVFVKSKNVLPVSEKPIQADQGDTGSGVAKKASLVNEPVRKGDEKEVPNFDECRHVTVRGRGRKEAVVNSVKFDDSVPKGGPLENDVNDVSAPESDNRPTTVGGQSVTGSVKVQQVENSAVRRDYGSKASSPSAAVVVNGKAFAGGGDQTWYAKSARVADPVLRYGMAVKLLQSRISTLNKVLAKEITDHAQLHDEHQRCYDILNEDPVAGTTLDETLQAILARFSRELGQNENDSECKRKQVSSLDLQIRTLRADLSRQISQKNAQLEQLRRALEHTERQLRDARNNAVELGKRQGTCEKQVVYWKDRCEMLEKSRRLGFYYLARGEEGQSASMVRCSGNNPGAQGPLKKLVYCDAGILDVDENSLYVKVKNKPVCRDGLLDWTWTRGGVTKGVGCSVDSVGTRYCCCKEKPLTGKVKEVVQRQTSPRKVSQYHVNCVPPDASLNASTGTFNNSDGLNSSMRSSMISSKHARETALNKSQTGLLSTSKKRPQSDTVSSDSTNKSVNTAVNTAGSNTAVPNKAAGTLPAPHRYPVQSAGTIHGTERKYGIPQQQSFGPGVFRPAPPARGPRHTPASGAPGYPAGGFVIGPGVAVTWVTPEGRGSYSNGLAGLDETTQTSRRSSASTVGAGYTATSGAAVGHSTGRDTKAAKDKFDESYSEAVAAMAGHRN